MEATIQRAKETDPKELRRTVTQLRGELSRLHAQQPETEIRHVEVPILDDAIARRLEAALLEAEGFSDSLRRVATQIVETVAQAQRALDASRAARPMLSRRLPSPPVPTKKIRPLDIELSKQAQRMAEELARRSPVTLTEGQLAVLSGYRLSSSQWGPNLRNLIAAGYVERSGQELLMTERGLSLLGGVSSAPVTIDEWIAKLPKQPATMLKELATSGQMSLDDLSTRTGYSMTSSQFGPALRTLIRIGLVVVEDKIVRLGEALESVGRR
ncbi:MAG: hypothetical protein ACRD1Z_09825 [Vicinamibacteria bacterium]